MQEIVKIPAMSVAMLVETTNLIVRSYDAMLQAEVEEDAVEDMAMVAQLAEGEVDVVVVDCHNGIVAHHPVPMSRTP